MFYFSPKFLFKIFFARVNIQRFKYTAIHGAEDRRKALKPSYKLSVTTARLQQDLECVKKFWKKSFMLNFTKILLANLEF